ncbi:MAG: arginine N-succinyltransferase, partial [Oleibacter sp.]|nr:arginine N-succinyltransferase [Thalassolituus sp.]
DRVVDIFDAGPLMLANINNIRSIQATRHANGALMRQQDLAFAKSKMIITNGHWHDFRVICSAAVAEGSELMLNAESLNALALESQQTLAYMPE